mmetsp:Transcript_2315/g.8633  ORF Transcript_2315/g.8633 Transcript_2315/m.8633 type:complete len:124 (+) Transcript_2315:2467-2838(+)
MPARNIFFGAGAIGQAGCENVCELPPPPPVLSMRGDNQRERGLFGGDPLLTHSQGCPQVQSRHLFHSAPQGNHDTVSLTSISLLSKQQSLQIVESNHSLLDVDSFQQVVHICVPHLFAHGAHH